MNICVIGTGYVGLVTGVVLANLGNEVTCVDNNVKKVEGLLNGIMPIYEPGLEEMVARNVHDERLFFTTDLEAAVAGSSIVFIAVGTPPREDGSTDLQYVEAAAKGVAQSISKYTVIVNKSTVPVGTGQFVHNVIAANNKKGIAFDVVSNPEFLREGSAIADTLEPDRIVIGASSRSVAMPLIELYAPLERPMVVTDVCSAEMIKYAANAFLATKMSFANAVANICESVGADVSQVVKGMGMDSRIGRAFLSAGIGYGGSCFPKDTRSLLSTAKANGYDFPLLEATILTNEMQTPRFLSRIQSVMGEDLTGKTIGILGLAFKSNTDDMREAKSIDLIHGLVAAGAKVQAYDPIAIENARAYLPPIEYLGSAYQAAKDADAVVVVTEWNEFRQLNFEHLWSEMRNPVVFDGRNIYDPEKMQRYGFEYHSIGRPSKMPLVPSREASVPASVKPRIHFSHGISAALADSWPA